ncbi:hypothetical protein Lal_00039823 [Lupinus albus]|nr:hypothetical protein Lal_00039823 [Lupinus albus]
MCLGVGFSLKRENPAHFKNSDLTLSLKRGSYSLYSSRVHFSPRRDNSRSGEPTLAQARPFSLRRESFSIAQDSTHPDLIVNLVCGDPVISVTTLAKSIATHFGYTVTFRKAWSE